MKHRRFLLAAFTVVAVPSACALDGCNDFRTDGGPTGVEAGKDTQAAEASPGIDAAMDGTADAHDGSPTDDSPLDFECPRWTKEPRDPDCAPRRTFVLEKNTAIDSSTLRVAVGAPDRIAIAYNAMQSADEGHIHVFRFVGDAVSTQPLVISETQFDNVGFSLDIVAGPDSEFSLAYQTAPSNEIVYRTVAQSGPPSPTQLVVGGMADPASMALTVAPSGEVRATYSSPGQRSIFSKAKPRGGTWGAATLVASYRDDDDGGGSTSVPGAWHVSAVSDESGSTHAAFHAPRAKVYSEPRYTQFTGTAWNDSKVLDNSVGTSTAGFSIALGLVGTLHHAVFYHRALSATVADLRLASWTGGDSLPTIQILDQNIPSANANAPRYRVAMAIDRWGLVHLVVARPSPTGAGGEIEYLRQSRRGGQVSWLSDIIDDDILSDVSGAPLVAIAIGPNGRPHIAYYRASDNSMVYATRTDRQN
ncbi:hypothetical protein LVJ94_27800 [Pendulispora rubella]|uniref:Uncharacterized protein n=1 Tax=Pendulispora rubella TaxID=2741070 RepID=A0ABZ2KWR5_9BACT